MAMNSVSFMSPCLNLVLTVCLVEWSVVAIAACEISDARECLLRLSTASAAIVVEFADIGLVYEFTDAMSNVLSRRVAKFGHLAWGNG